MITSKEKPTNHPIYAVNYDLDSFIFFKFGCPEEEKKIPVVISELEEEENKKQDIESNDKEGKEMKAKVDEEEGEEHIWSMNFDGAWIIHLVIGKSKSCSYKLPFDCTNNVAEYEALLSGLQVLKRLGAKRISIYGYFELIIKHINGEC